MNELARQVMVGLVEEFEEINKILNSNRGGALTDDTVRD